MQTYPFVWIAILIALAPSFSLFAYLARGNKPAWLSFAIGGGGLAAGGSLLWF